MSVPRENEEEVIVVGAPPDGRGDVRASVSVIQEGEAARSVEPAPNRQAATHEEDDPYSVEDVEPMSKAQRIVILCVIAGVAFLAFYLLRYWNIF